MHSAMLRPFALPAAMAFALGTVTGSAASPQVTGGPTAGSLGVVPGARVRVVAADYGDAPQIGTVAAVGGDGIVFRRERQGDSLTISFAHMARLDLSRGRHAHPFSGLGIGFAGGAVAGALVGLVTYHKPSCAGNGTFFCGVTDYGAGGNAAGYAILGGAQGAVIGLVIGSFIRTERWRTLPLNSLVDHAQAGVNLIPSPMGPCLAVRVAVRF